MLELQPWQQRDKMRQGNKKRQNERNNKERQDEIVIKDAILEYCRKNFNQEWYVTVSPIIGDLNPDYILYSLVQASSDSHGVMLENVQSGIGFFSWKVRMIN